MVNTHYKRRRSSLLRFFVPSLRTGRFSSAPPSESSDPIRDIRDIRGKICLCPLRLLLPIQSPFAPVNKSRFHPRSKFSPSVFAWSAVQASLLPNFCCQHFRFSAFFCVIFNYFSLSPNHFQTKCK